MSVVSYLPCLFLTIANGCRNRITPKNLTHEKSNDLVRGLSDLAVRWFEQFVLLTFKGGVSFVDLFCYLCFVSFMLSCLSIAFLWPPAGKGLASWLSCM